MPIHVTEKVYLDLVSPKSDLRASLINNAVARDIPSGAKHGNASPSAGVRPDLDNKFFRSAWEANYARYLNFLVAQGQVLSWEYEPQTFWFPPIKRGTRSYLPDFRVIERKGAEPVFHEVKGWFDRKSMTKLKRMAKYHPDVKIKVIDNKVYRDLSRQVGRIIPHWEFPGDTPL